MDDSVRKILDDADQASRQAADSLGDGSDAMRRVAAAADVLVDGFKTLGAVTVSVSGTMAAWTVNAGKEAARLLDLSRATGVGTREVQQLGSVYEQAGGDAKSYEADAKAYFEATGKALDVQAMKELSTVGPDLAQHLGKAFTSSDIMNRVLGQGPEAIQAAADRADRSGQVLGDEPLARLAAMNGALGELQGVFDKVSMLFSAGASPALTDGIKALTAALVANRDAFETLGNATGQAVGTFAKLLGNAMNGDWSVASYLETGRNAEEERKSQLEATSKTRLQTETLKIAKNLGISEEYAAKRAAVEEGARLRIKENPEDKEAHDTLYSRPSEERIKYFEGTLNRPLVRYISDDEEMNSLIRGELSPMDKKKKMAYLLAEKEMRQQQSQEREFIPTPASQLPGKGGDYTNNSGNTSQNVTNYNEVHVQVVTPDPAAAGQAVFTEIQNVQKVRHPGPYHLAISP